MSSETNVHPLREQSYKSRRVRLARIEAVDEFPALFQRPDAVGNPAGDKIVP